MRAKIHEPRTRLIERSLLAVAVAVTGTLGNLAAHAATFGEELEFLRKHTEAVVLSDRAGRAQVAVIPAWQGRVMTSTASGNDGLSFGWINHELIAARKVQPHINVFGGEDRFWMGPEGGQFSIFFAKGVPFDLEHWFTPAPFDTEPFTVLRKGSDQVHLRHAFGLTNYY